MPDALEAQANGPQVLRPPGEATVWSQAEGPNQAGDIPVTLVGEIPAASPSPSPAAPNSASVPEPSIDEQRAQLAETSKKMIATQTQWTQRASAAEQKAINAQQQYEAKLHELNIAAQQPNNGPDGSPSFKDLLPQSQYDALDPDAKSLLGAVEALMDGKVGALQASQGNGAESSEEVKALNARLAQLEGTQTQTRVATGLQEIRQTYGDQVAAQYQNEIAATISQVPGANPFQVMAIVDPALAMQHAQSQGAQAAAQQKIQQQDGSLAGVQPSPSAQSAQTPYVEGEDFAASWNAATGGKTFGWD